MSPLKTNKSTRPALWYRGLVVLILTIHTGLLAWSAWAHSPLVDEPAHLAAGVSHWKKFSFDLYRVNPPLVRMFAALPVLLVPHNEDWSSYSDDLYRRSEFQVGTDFIKANAEHYRLLLFYARCCCILLSVLGGYMCYRFAQELFDGYAGIISLLLWCSSPIILAFGYTVMPDVGSAALGITACYFFYMWLKEPTWHKSLLAAFFLGIAELSKFTLLVFYLIFPTIWVIRFFTTRAKVPIDIIRAQVKQLLAILCISIVAINFFYGFEGTFISLKEYEFVSRTFCGKTKWNHETGFTPTGNRFRETLLAPVPVPLPTNYVLGIDVQKKDFEIGRDSYFWGKWSQEGWYTYYLLGLIIKEPLSFWILCAISFFLFMGVKAYRADTCSEAILMIPVFAILLLISSQAKLNHHLRYAIPILPFLFVFVGRLGKIDNVKQFFTFILSIFFVSWCILSSLWFYPHSQTYFNILIGQPNNAPTYLLGSNIDWGQSLFYLEKWCKEHPEIKEIKVAYEECYPIELSKVPSTGMPPTHDPQPGWYALSVNYLYDREKQYRYFLNFEPVARIGYSIYIYHLTQEDVDQISTITSHF